MPGTRWSMRTESKVWVITAFFLAVFGLGLYSAFRPESYPLRFIRGEVRPIADNVLIGPYPGSHEWKRLRDRMGVDVMVSLMDPSSRVEGGFVREERAMARKYGMEFMNYPMDFMRLSDRATRETAERLARYIIRSGGNRRFYVHCYLGRHRVRVFSEAFARARAAAREPAGGRKTPG